ncbi:UNKNOWN [Stylonychia lemnae]|uniref:Uncharacterized protein n=1 Tax=Stylonychia lemnae TaxID=5949 RepID=A0A078APB1_STYLE|nr:UNKNOWN [Stylonychia lemnae]|eukprot:CDW83776.1 UNKNOWN [Stylonychia lemnae]
MSDQKDSKKNPQDKLDNTVDGDETGDEGDIKYDIIDPPIVQENLITGEKKKIGGIIRILRFKGQNKRIIQAQYTFYYGYHWINGILSP